MLLRLFQTVLQYLARVFLKETTTSDRSSPLSTISWRERLACRGRPTLSPSDFAPRDQLFRGFKSDEVDDGGAIDIDTLRLPDMSCNWSRFSVAEDVRYRMPGCEKEGCYAFTIEVARYKSIAIPCHDPICGVESENYSHVEIRELLENESDTFVPPKGRKSRGKQRKVLRAEWKTNIVNNLDRLFEPEFD
jgi:hypothetical protein